MTKARARPSSEPASSTPLVHANETQTATPTRIFLASPADTNQRLDQFLARELGISRSRAQLLIKNAQVKVAGITARSSQKLRAEEEIAVTGDPQPAPLRAIPESIDLDIVYEDSSFAIINKPSGMMVHAGAGSTEDDRNRGTLVNALLHHFQSLSDVGGSLRPGIVHRLDKFTSGLIVVAKNDSAHLKLSEMFAKRQVSKTYIALAHGRVKDETGTIAASIQRDTVRRTRMTTRGSGGRTAVSHFQLIEDVHGSYGDFSLVEVTIETGRTHQIRVHMGSIGHPLVGDALYGAPRAILPIAIPTLAPSGRHGKRTIGQPNATQNIQSKTTRKTSRSAAASSPSAQEAPPLALPRTFLHAARLAFPHPLTGKPMQFQAPLPAELTAFLAQLKESST